MSDRQRHRAFAFSVLFAAAACVLVWLFERPRSGDRAEAAPVTRAVPSRPLVLGGEAPQAPGGEAARRPRTEPGAPPSGQSVAGAAGGVAIISTARRFTVAFLQYEVDLIPARVRRLIKATATPPFANSLLSAPPRLPRGVPSLPPERLRSVTLTGGPDRGHAAVTVELRAADGQTSALNELLERSGRGWRVSNLG